MVATAPATEHRIWFHPPKFWAATRDLPPEQAELIMQEVLMLAEARDLQALAQFDFIRVERRLRQAS
ncbi:MAG: hypothetical protein L0Z53_11465 [Acidobacteriales bacterium]|nr:hypothetical protein [Terriglobales bacterium]